MLQVHRVFRVATRLTHQDGGREERSGGLLSKKRGTMALQGTKRSRERSEKNKKSCEAVNQVEKGASNG